MRNFCNLIGSEQCGISAKFEIPTCENYKPFVGSSINKKLFRAVTTKRAVTRF